MTDSYQVSEIFDSVQGEGVHTGVPCTFIRLQGCTVGCPWCDTKHTWAKGGTRMTSKEIMASVHYQHVVITGGEPLLYNLDPLLIPLYEEWHYVHLESSGQQDFKGIYSVHWVVWSPKKSLGWDASERFKRLVNEVKFVVDDDLEIKTVEDIEDWYRDWYANVTHKLPPIITLMPEGCPPSQEHMQKAFDWVMANPRWRISDRLQYRLGVR